MFAFLLFFQNTALADEITEKKSLFWTPLASFIIPGLGQAIDGESSRSLLFAGYGFAGISLYVDFNDKYEKGLPDPEVSADRVQDYKVYGLAAQAMYMHAGFLSAYDTFSSRVKAYQAEGKYQFYPKDQSMEDLLKAPFHFNYLKRPTTWIPFFLGILGGYYTVNSSDVPEHTVRANDLAVSTYVSYEAGTGEEAFFRGYLHPILYEETNGSWVANAGQAVVFGFAHGPKAYPQLAMGYYLGWLAEKNQFELGEGIFVHAWWDFFVLAGELIRQRSLAQPLYVQFPSFVLRF